MNDPAKSYLNPVYKNLFVVFSAVEEEKKEDVLLWSHYADLHRGICIEFTPNYKNKKSPFYWIEKVHYSDTIPASPKSTENKEKNDYMKKILTTKAKCWEFEKEWRVVISKKYGNKVEELRDGFNVERGRLHSFEPSELTKVTIGCKATKNDERIVFNWIDNLGNDEVIVEKCCIDETKYHLKFVDIY